MASGFIFKDRPLCGADAQGDVVSHIEIGVCVCPAPHCPGRRGSPALSPQKPHAPGRIHTHTAPRPALPPQNPPPALGRTHTHTLPHGRPSSLILACSRGFCSNLRVQSWEGEWGWNGPGDAGTQAFGGRRLYTLGQPQDTSGDCTVWRGYEPALRVSGLAGFFWKTHTVFSHRQG